MISHCMRRGRRLEDEQRGQWVVQMTCRRGLAVVPGVEGHDALGEERQVLHERAADGELAEGADDGVLAALQRHGGEVLH